MLPAVPPINADQPVNVTSAGRPGPRQPKGISAGHLGVPHLPVTCLGRRQADEPLHPPAGHRAWCSAHGDGDSAFVQTRSLALIRLMAVGGGTAQLRLIWAPKRMWSAQFFCAPNRQGDRKITEPFGPYNGGSTSSIR